jgi:O-antigen ligase
MPAIAGRIAPSEQWAWELWMPHEEWLTVFERTIETPEAPGRSIRSARPGSENSLDHLAPFTSLVNFPQPGEGHTPMRDSLSRTGQAYQPRHHPPSLTRPRSAIFHALISFETAFVLFMFAGQYKALPEFAWFPVDLTAFFFVLSLSFAIFASATSVNVLSALEERGMVFFLIFMAWVLGSLLWSSFLVENRTKALHSATLTLWSFLGAYLFISRSWVTVRRFLIGIVVISLILLLYWCYHRFFLGMVLFSADEEAPTSYQEYGFLGQYLVSALLGLTIVSRGAIPLLASTLGLVTVFVVMLFIGSRAPVLFSLVSVPLALFMLLRRHRMRLLAVLLSLCVVVGLLIAVTLWLGGPNVIEQIEEQMTTFQRFQTYNEPGFGSSMAGRIDAQLFALARWTEAPIIGWGLGEFALMHYLRYPHNLFLEMLMETGVVGFCLLVALTGLGLVRAWRLWPENRSNWTAITLVLLYINELMMRATVQGFLSEERVLFALLGLIMGIGERIGDQKSASR